MIASLLRTGTLGPLIWAPPYRCSLLFYFSILWSYPAVSDPPEASWSRFPAVSKVPSATSFLFQFGWGVAYFRPISYEVGRFRFWVVWSNLGWLRLFQYSMPWCQNTFWCARWSVSWFFRLSFTLNAWLDFFDIVPSHFSLSASSDHTFSSSRSTFGRIIALIRFGFCHFLPSMRRCNPSETSPAPSTSHAMILNRFSMLFLEFYARLQVVLKWFPHLCVTHSADHDL